MAESLYELIAPHWIEHDKSSSAPPSPNKDATTAQYLNRLSTLSLHSLKTTEPQSLAQSSQSTLLSLQALSNRSHKAIIACADNLSTLRASLPQLTSQAQQLREAIPRVDEEAVRFSETYSKSSDNVTLVRRKRAMQLARNVDRLSDILELPTLLSTAVSSAAASSVTASGGSSSTTYSSALDLHAHIKRLQTLYPESTVIKDVAAQAEDAMREMTTSLIGGLRSQNIRLAAAMRMVGWLRRVAPELESAHSNDSSHEGALGALFLICRLANLVATLDALDPLRELADNETQRRLRGTAKQQQQQSSSNNSNPWSEGHQTERYLKRYIEIFREQSFTIVSLYKQIFSPDQSDSELAAAGLRRVAAHDATGRPDFNISQLSRTQDPLLTTPPALATFPMHLVQLLAETLRTYLPNVQDRSSRESLLTQVLYCAASLGRLGGDFSMILADLGDGPEDTVREWEEVTRKHRVLAGRLEQLTSGTVSPESKGTLPVTSPVH